MSLFKKTLSIDSTSSFMMKKILGDVTSVASLTIGTDCEVVVVSDGEEKYYSAGKHVLPKKGKFNSEIYLVNKACFTEPWGVFDVPYCERTSLFGNVSNTVLVGMHGKVTFKVDSAMKLKAMLPSLTEITSKDVKEQLFGKLTEASKSVLSSCIEKKKYEEVNSHLSEISQSIATNSSFKKLFLDLGISLVSVSVEEVHFPEDYIERFKNKDSDMSNETAKVDKVIEEAKKKEEAENEKAPINIVVFPSAPSSKKCSRCGYENESDAFYCKKCGEKL